MRLNKCILLLAILILANGCNKAKITKLNSDKPNIPNIILQDTTIVSNSSTCYSVPIGSTPPVFHNKYIHKDENSSNYTEVLEFKFDLGTGVIGNIVSINGGDEINYASTHNKTIGILYGKDQNVTVNDNRIRFDILKKGDYKSLLATIGHYSKTKEQLLIVSLNYAIKQDLDIDEIKKI